jgi:hypothetical protein
VESGPRVEDVALEGAVCLADVFAQVDGEASLAVCGLAMDRARAASLLAAAAQLLEQAQVTQHLFHGEAERGRGSGVFD